METWRPVQVPDSRRTLPSLGVMTSQGRPVEPGGQLRGSGHPGLVSLEFFSEAAHHSAVSPTATSSAWFLAVSFWFENAPALGRSPLPRGFLSASQVACARCTPLLGALHDFSAHSGARDEVLSLCQLLLRAATPMTWPGGHSPSPPVLCVTFSRAPVAHGPHVMFLHCFFVFCLPWGWELPVQPGPHLSTPFSREYL